MKLKHLIDQPDKLPTISKVGQQLIASFRDEDVSSSQIAAQLALDPALSARVLRLANSAYFRVPRSIGTVAAALDVLGLVMVRNLVIGCTVAAAFKATPGLDLKQFWRYNLYTACAARWLAGQAEVDTDDVFTLGVLHGIGQLHMHVVMPTELVALNRQMSVLDTRRAQLELDSFGFHYGDVSAELAQVWNFPLSLVDALRHVAQPLAAPTFSESAAWVHLGSWRASVEVLGLGYKSQLDSYPVAVARRLHLNLEPNWTPALAEAGHRDARGVMPPLSELSAGLEALFE
jgi:HD-like signal output (HDOD) protein